MTAVAIEAERVVEQRDVAEASFATEVPEPIESPTLAKLSAGASFVPSPVTATTSPRCCNNCTRRCLSSGRARDMIFSVPVPVRATLRRSLRRTRRTGDVVAVARPRRRPTARSGGRSQRAVAGRVARHDLDADSCLPTCTSARRRERLRGPGRRWPPTAARCSSARLFDPLRGSSSRRGFGPCHGQRTHGAALDSRAVAPAISAGFRRSVHIVRARSSGAPFTQQDAAARESHRFRRASPCICVRSRRSAGRRIRTPSAQ